MRRATAAVIGLAGSAAAFRSYPVFKQCDPAWGSDEMGTAGNGERSTICGEGCAMSSTSMALNGLGITIDGISANPQSLNAWLERTPGGYLCAAGDCNNLNLTIIQDVGSPTAPHLELIGELPKPSIPDIQAGLTAGDTVYIAHGRYSTSVSVICLLFCCTFVRCFPVQPPVICRTLPSFNSSNLCSA